AGPGPAADSIRVNLAWLPQGSTGGILVALAKGYYAEAGLDVSVVRGYGGQRTVNEVDQGLFDFAYGDPVSVVLNRSQGGHTKMVAAINTVWPAALCYVDRPDRHFSTVADLEGLTLGGGIGSPLHNIVPAWLEANGLPETHIKLLRLDPAVINASLLQGRIDLAECWEGANRPLLERMAHEEGKQIRWVRYRDFSLDLYGNGIVTTDAVLAAKPDLVRRFLKATFQGYELQRSNPDLAADAILSVPLARILDRGVLLEQIRETNDLVIDRQAPDLPAGRMRDERMAATVDFVVKAFKLAAAPSIGDVFTNRYLD
ncbi:MAG: ABC transporter substrate-binding protein, partial [Acidobacteriota bacterium]|nr:ABC transporter substrate-binding protein [Acidobacteriota bacterium]